MSFSQELKDFAGGFEKGWKLIKDPTREDQIARKNREMIDNAPTEAVDTGDLPSTRRASTDTPGTGRSRRSDNDGDLPGINDAQVAEVAPILKMARADSGHNYNALTYGGKESENPNLTNMTLKEVFDYQSGMPGRGHASTAVGGYQFIKPTLESAVKAAGLDPNTTKFTAEVQDRLAAQLVKNRGYDDFKAGKISADKFANNLSQEWAILPKNASGAGFYDGINGNKAGVKWADFQGALGSVAPNRRVAGIPARVPAMNPNDRPVYTDSRVHTAALNLDDSVYAGQTDLSDTPMYAAGGLVQSFADGGMVREPEPSPPPSPTAINVANTEHAGSNPAVRDQMEGHGDDYDPKAFVDMHGAAEAVDGGMKYLQKKFGFDKPRPALAEADPETDQAHRAFAHNVGAASPDEVEMVKNTVDPRRQLSEEQRLIAGYNASYKYWMRQGYPERAQRAAGAMLMASKDAAAKYGALAQTAAENGDLEGAGKAIAAANDQVPDGRTLKIDGRGDKGLKYRFVDASGQVTDQGEATMDDVMYLATGMRNGTEWFRSMGMLKSKYDATGARQEKERAAIEDFERTRLPDEKDFISTLDDDAREKYLKLPVRAQNIYRKEHAQRLEQERKQGNFDVRRDDKISLDEIKQDNWERARETKMDLDERRLAQRERDLDDRNARHDESMAARKERYAQIDARIIAQRAEKAARGTAGPKLTATERASQALDLEGTGKIASIASDPRGIVGGADEAADGLPTYKLSPQQGVQIDAANAGTAFNKAQPKTPRKFDQKTYDALGEETTKVLEAHGVKDVSPDTLRVYQDIGSEIAAGTTMPPGTAARLAIAATRPSTRPRILDNGMVELVPGQPPVKLSETTMLRLAQIRGAQGGGGEAPAGNPAGNRPTVTVPNPLVGSAQAAPGATAPTEALPVSGANTTSKYATGNTAQTQQEADARQALKLRRDREDDARKSASDVRRERQAEQLKAVVGAQVEAKRTTKGAEYARLQEQLGPDFVQGMTLKMMRDELQRKQEREQRRSTPSRGAWSRG